MSLDLSLQNWAYYKWRYLQNFKPWVSYCVNRKPLAAQAQQLVDELNQKGIAITSEELLLGNEYFELLDREVSRLESEMAGSAEVDSRP